jgi:hypothetical protein
MTVEIQ